MQGRDGTVRWLHDPRENGDRSSAFNVTPGAYWVLRRFALPLFRGKLLATVHLLLVNLSHFVCFRSRFSNFGRRRNCCGRRTIYRRSLLGLVDDDGHSVLVLVVSSFFVRIYLFGGRRERVWLPNGWRSYTRVRNGALPSDMKCSIDLFNRPSGSFW